MAYAKVIMAVIKRSKKRRGGKRPGAGRRPSENSKSAWFSARLDPALRFQLDEEVKRSTKRNHSLSAEIEDRLNASFAKKKNEPDPQLAAIFYLLGECRFFVGRHADLKTDAYAFAVFRSAVIHILDRLMPKGPISPPDFPGVPSQVAEMMKNPEWRGYILAEEIWGMAQGLRRPTREELLAASDVPDGKWPNVASGTRPYAMHQAREALGIEPSSEKVNKMAAFLKQIRDSK
jgi:hypothetical protein